MIVKTYVLFLNLQAIPPAVNLKNVSAVATVNAFMHKRTLCQLLHNFIKCVEIYKIIVKMCSKENIQQDIEDERKKIIPDSFCTFCWSQLLGNILPNIIYIA